jgi:hypothetical protein
MRRRQRGASVAAATAPCLAQGSNNYRRMPWRLLVVTAVSWAASIGAVASEEPRRHPWLAKRGLGNVRQAGDASGQSLEEMWLREIALAQEEADRLLQGQVGGGMSVVPTSAPVPQPTTVPPASIVPTEQPAASGGPTLGPDSCLDGLTREEYLFAELSAITDPTLLANTSTPQGRAFEFMTVDPLQPNVCTYPTIDQRYGLATLAYSTNVANWTASDNWLQDAPECEWFGVACENGRVANLSLSESPTT